MDKVFAVAGVSTLEGVTKARFAKDMSRVKVLEKNGHTDVRLIELPKVMDKVSAIAFLVAHKDFQDAVAQGVLKTEDVAVPTVKVPKAKVEKVTKVKAVVKPAVKAEKTPAEVAKIKAKNLETLRKVGKSWAEQRSTEGEAMLLDAEEKIDALTEAGVPNYRWANIGIED